MKRLICLTLSVLLISSATFAQSTNEVEVVESKLKIKEISQLVGVQIPKNDTCLDELLMRRKELSKKLWLSPLTGAAEIGGGTAAGLGIGAIIAHTLVADGWAQLGALIGGGLLGFSAGAAVFITGSTVNIVKFANNDRLIKWIAEARLTAGGKATRKMVKKYQRKYDDNASEEDIAMSLIALDKSGALCDGSIVAPKRLKRGKKLKHLIAKKGEIFKKIHERISQ